MLDILFETEQYIEQKHSQFLGGTKGRMRELLERVWIDKLKWGKTYSCCRMGLYDDLKDELEEMGFYIFYEIRYGEKMFCVSWK